MKLYIRPVYSGDRLLSIALAATNQEVLVGEEILENLPADYGGAEIKQIAEEFHGSSDVEWGQIIQTEKGETPPHDEEEADRS